MGARLRFVTPEGDEAIEFTSNETVREWRDLRITYRGGWRSQIELTLEGVRA